jgi:hypothetical protein
MDFIQKFTLKDFRDLIELACSIKWDLLNDDELFDLIMYWCRPEDIPITNANELTKKILENFNPN